MDMNAIAEVNQCGNGKNAKSNRASGTRKNIEATKQVLGGLSSKKVSRNIFTRAVSALQALPAKGKRMA